MVILVVWRLDFWYYPSCLTPSIQRCIYVCMDVWMYGCMYVRCCYPNRLWLDIGSRTPGPGAQIYPSVSPSLRPLSIPIPIYPSPSRSQPCMYIHVCPLLSPCRRYNPRRRPSASSPQSPSRRDPTCPAHRPVYCGAQAPS